MPAQKNYQKYTVDTDFTDVDHIIVGSGIGGLTAAVWLAKAGKKVVVLERHYVPGGFTHSFKRKDGFNWDTGVHYVGNVHKGQPLQKLFGFITSDKLKWNPMGAVYDQVKIGTKTFDIPAGRDKYVSQMKAYFPNEEKVIETYVDLIEKSNRRANSFFFQKAFPPLLNMSLGAYLRNRFKPFSQRTTLEVLQEITENQELISVLCAQCGNYGLSPKHSSFGVHALVIGHFMEGGFYPEGGTDQIPKQTIDTLVKLGGRVLINAEVDEIVIEKNRVKGIRMGERFVPCKSVISNTGVWNTFNRLVSPEATARCKVAELDQAEHSTGHICLYVGLDASDEKLRLPKHNIWHFENGNIDMLMDDMSLEDAPSKFSYISFPSAKDSAWAKTNPNQATIQMITMGRYEWFAQYEGTRWKKRGAEYEHIKDLLKEQMTNKLIGLYPQLEGHIQYAEISTPLSTAHFANYHRGQIYGLAHSPARFKLGFLRPETRIKGLRLVGQDILIVGLASAMLSGMLCAITILKFRVWKLFREMNKEEG